MKPAVLLLPLILAACTPQPPAAPESTSVAPAATVEQAAAVPATLNSDAAPLPKYHWQLSKAEDSQGEPIDALFARKDKPLQLDFADGRIQVGNACNVMNGDYKVSDGKLQVGAMMRTMMACADPAVNALDGAMDSRLHDHPTLHVEANGDTPRLHLLTASGDALVFTGAATAQTRYGGNSHTEFLEVAPQTVPCSDPPTGSGVCLQVRAIHYDGGGVRSGNPGLWHAMRQPIEGYTHHAGIRNVLRVKRYVLDSVPAGAATSAYVLDGVVETEAVKPTP